MQFSVRGTDNGPRHDGPHGKNESGVARPPRWGHQHHFAAAHAHLLHLDAGAGEEIDPRDCDDADEAERTSPASPPCDISNELAVMPVPGGTRLDVVLRLFGSGIDQESVWLPYPSSMCEEIIDRIHHGGVPRPA
jgi:hypothetical protein